MHTRSSLDLSGPPGVTRSDAVGERARLHRELEASAQAAFARHGLVSRHFALQGRSFTLRFAGAALERAMTRALEHLVEVQPAPVPDLTIDCWDCASGDSPVPHPRWPERFFSARGEVLGLDSAGSRIAFFSWLNLLNAYFPAERKAYYCLAKGEPFPLQQAGSPALTIFNWWAETLGFQLVHGAVIGTSQGGVLIAGQGGAGKSTLAFSTLNGRLHYLSDDYFILATPATALGLFSSGKLTERSLRLLPSLRKQAANADDPGREKALFYLQECFPGKLLSSVPLRAIVLSCLCETETSLAPISPAEVHGIIVQSTLRQLAGAGAASLLRLRRLLHGLPVYRLNHGRDEEATHRLLGDLCG